MPLGMKEERKRHAVAATRDHGSSCSVQRRHLDEQQDALCYPHRLGMIAGRPSGTANKAMPRVDTRKDRLRAAHDHCAKLCLD